MTATPAHRFFVVGRGAVPLGQLGIGTEIVTRAGPPLVIASLVHHHWPHGVLVYNLEVQGDHTYFVGNANDGTWVHNDCYDLDQQALIDIAKQSARRGGVSSDEAQILRDWANEYNIPSRGPEVHPNRPFGQFPHIHIGPVNHLPVVP